MYLILDLKWHSFTRISLVITVLVILRKQLSIAFFGFEGDFLSLTKHLEMLIW